MGRKRSAAYDYVCQRCGVACDISGDRHYRGGRSPRACRRAKPVLRSEHEAMLARFAADAAAALADRIRL